MAQLLVDHGRPEQAAFYRVPEALGHVTAATQELDCVANGHVPLSRRSRVLSWPSYHRLPAVCPWGITGLFSASPRRTSHQLSEHWHWEAAAAYCCRRLTERV